MFENLSPQVKLYKPLVNKLPLVELTKNLHKYLIWTVATKLVKGKLVQQY